MCVLDNLPRLIIIDAQQQNTSLQAGRHDISDQCDLVYNMPSDTDRDDHKNRW